MESVASLADVHEVRDILIIGADGLIGQALMQAFTSKGFSVIGTSRRDSDRYFYLDLAKPIDLSALPKARIVFLCAGINGFAACDADPVMAAQVNIVTTLAIGTHYMRQGGHVVFLSSTTVFGNNTGKPDEEDKVTPDTTYGVFKCATEIALHKASKNTDGQCTIVRLSKVFSANSLLLKQWREQGLAGKSIDAYSDVLIAPVSIEYVVIGLLKVVENQSAGYLHLSGEQTISYKELAYSLCEKWLIPKTRVNGISQSTQMETASPPQCSVLGMLRTKSLLGIQAQPFSEFVLSIGKETEFAQC